MYPQTHHLPGDPGDIRSPIRLPKRPEVYEIKGDTLTIWFEERSPLAYYGSTFGEIGRERVESASRRSGAGYGRGAWVGKRVDHQWEKTHRKQGLVSVARDIIDSNTHSTLATADEYGLLTIRRHQKNVDQDISVVIVECVG